MSKYDNHITNSYDLLFYYPAHIALFAVSTVKLSLGVHQDYSEEEKTFLSYTSGTSSGSTTYQSHDLGQFT